MNKIKHTKILLSILLANWCCFLYSAQEQPGSNVGIYRNQSIAAKESDSFDADLLIKKANENYLNKNYEDAAKKYLKVISLLSKNEINSFGNQDKIIKVKDALSNVYLAWSRELIKEAKLNFDSGNIDKAISLCKEASSMNKEVKPEADELLSMYTDLKNNIVSDSKGLSSEEKVNYKNKLYEIDVLYTQGQNLYDKKLYDQASSKFQKILALDPYNSNAIEYIRRINDQRDKVAQYKTSVTSMERKLEVELEKSSHVKVKASDGENISSTNTPIKKTESIDTITKNLNSVIIKKLSLEDVPIDSALLFLKNESQKEDPSGKGVNFYLQITPKPQPPATQNQQAQGTAGTQQGNVPVADVNPANEYLVNLELENVPLGKAIDYICKSVGLKYRIGKYAIEVFTPDVQISDLKTVVIPADSSIFPTTDIKTFFVERGISFPPGSSIVYDVKISRLVVRNSDSEIQKIQKVLEESEKTLPQVSISTKFIEMSQTDFDELGFQWNASRTGRPGVNFQENENLVRFADDAKANVGALEPVPDRELGFSYANAGFDLDAVMHALNQNTRVEVLSSPRITTLSGNKATIKVVTDQYFPTSWSDPTISTSTGSSASSSATMITPSVPTLGSATQIGIVLTVLPIVSSDNYTVDLVIEPVVKDFVGWTSYKSTINDETTNTTLYKNIKMPKFSLRTTQSSVKLFDGDTLVMGGAIGDTTTTTNDIVPILGDIPLVGRFFQSEISHDVKTNLLIFTTINLVKPDGTLLRPEKNNGLPLF